MSRGTPRLPLKSLDAVLTAACNLKCGYCYQNAKNRSRMDWATLRACVDLLLSSRRRDVLLTFYGGEPLLEFPMVRRAVAYAEARKPKQKRVRYGIVTNGTLFGPDVAAFLDRHRFETRLSFDGNAAAQDLRAKGTFRVLDRLLDFLRTDRPRFFRDDLSVNVTLHSGNLRHLADSIDYFLGKGVHAIILGPLVTHDEEWRRDTIEDLEIQMARAYRSCVRHYWRTGRIPLTVLRGNEAEARRDPFGLSLCGVGSGETLSVNPDGRVCGCVMFADAYQTFPSPDLRRRFGRMEMGDLRDPRFPERYARYPAATRAVRIFDDRHLKRSSYGRCDRCDHVSSCVVCPVSIGHFPGSPDPHRIPDSVCAINLVASKYRKRFSSSAGAYEFLVGKAALSVETRELRSFALSRSAVAPRRPPP